jgi:hypothetical protein
VQRRGGARPVGEAPPGAPRRLRVRPWPSETCVDGIGISVAPIAAHSVTLDRNREALPTFTMDPPAVRVFWISGTGAVTSRPSLLGRFAGPHARDSETQNNTLSWRTPDYSVEIRSFLNSS